MSKMTTQELQAISRAVADPRRFDILQHIAGSASMACSDMRMQFPIGAATLSHHLKELESAGLIMTERRGKFVDATFQRKVWRRYLKEMKRLLGQIECKTE